MRSLNAILFNKFGPSEAIYDVNKDIEGKGTVERYNDCVSLDFDEQVMPLISDMVANLLDPFTAYLKFIPYLEAMLGVNFSLFIEEVKRRKFVSLVNKIYDIKGTLPAYQIMIKWLGFDDVYIIEHESDGGFDSIYPFDSNKRTFDSGSCGTGCREYSIQLEGSITLTAEIINQIYEIIKFNEPIDARLRSLTYNGSYVIQEVISVYISDGTDGFLAGDLVYNNDNDPFLILALATALDEPTYSEGDLIISGPNADKYYINNEGDLIYTSSTSWYFNNAMLLNASPINQHISFSDIAEYALIGGDFQVGVWINSTELGTQELCSKNSATDGWRLYTDNGKVYVEILSNGLSNLIESSFVVNDGSWHWVLFTYNGTDADNYQLYIDNVEDSFVTVQNNLLNGNVDNINDIYIGRSLGNYGIGLFDSFLFSSGVMVEQQRIDYYNYGEGNDEFLVGIQNVLLRSNFDEILGFQIFDQSQYLNHGLLVNGLGDSSNRVAH
jgi:hypothetical protein